MNPLPLVERDRLRFRIDATSTQLWERSFARRKNGLQKGRPAVSHPTAPRQRALLVDAAPPEKSSPATSGDVSFQKTRDEISGRPPESLSPSRRLPEPLPPRRDWPRRSPPYAGGLREKRRRHPTPRTTSRASLGHDARPPRAPYVFRKPRFSVANNAETA